MLSEKLNLRGLNVRIENKRGPLSKVLKPDTLNPHACGNPPGLEKQITSERLL